MIERHEKEEARPRSSCGFRIVKLAARGAEAKPDAERARPRMRVADVFHVFAHKSSEIVGRPWAFALAIFIILVWGILGPLFGFSDTWQLVINTATTVVTFLMVFLLQNTQNRDSRAIHLKLDELLHAVKGARNQLIDLEDLSEEELNELQKEFEKVRQQAPAAKYEGKKQDKK